MAGVIEGKWEMVSNEGLFDFLAKIGSDVLEGTPITIEWTAPGEGSEFWVQEVTAGNRSSYNFKFDVPFDHMTTDLKPSTSTISFDGNNTLTHVQKIGDFSINTTRVFNGCCMETTIEATGIDCCPTACFKKCCA